MTGRDNASNEILSQAEIDSLLTPSQFAAGRANRSAEKVDPQPQVVALFDDDDSRLLQSLHQSVAQDFSASLTGLLQRPVESQLLAIETPMYSQFIFDCSEPTSFFVLDASPLQNRWAIELEPAILYPLLDCLLGGGQTPFTIPHRPPTQN